MTVHELMALYLERKKQQGKRWYKMRSQLHPLRAILGGYRVEDLKPAVFETYRDRRRMETTKRGGPPEHSTINRELTYLRAALRMLQEDELLDRVPRFRLRKETGRRTDWWTPEQLEAVMAALRPRQPCLADLVEFYYVSGWRKKEALGLTWNEVDLDRGVISLQGDRTKEKDERVLPIVGRIAEIMERRRQDRRDGVPWVFHRNGEQRHDFARAWARARKVAGCENVLHGFRRTMARRYLLQKFPIELIMKIGGWKSREMVERYARLETQDLADAMLAVEH